MNAQTETMYTPRTGNQQDFIGELYGRYGKKLLSYAVHTWHMDEDDAWELIYKTLYKVIDTYTNYTFEKEEKFAGFIFRIFINLLRNHYRDNKDNPLKQTTSDLEESMLATKEEEVNEVAPDRKLSVLKKELEKLEDWQRILLLMRSDGRPYSDIAQYVNRPEEQLKVYYQRLKKAIAEKMYEEFE